MAVAGFVTDRLPTARRRGRKLPPFIASVLLHTTVLLLVLIGIRLRPREQNWLPPPAVNMVFEGGAKQAPSVPNRAPEKPKLPPSPPQALPVPPVQPAPPVAPAPPVPRAPPAPQLASPPPATAPAPQEAPPPTQRSVEPAPTPHPPVVPETPPPKAAAPPQTEAPPIPPPLALPVTPPTPLPAEPVPAPAPPSPAPPRPQPPMESSIQLVPPPPLPLQPLPVRPRPPARPAPPRPRAQAAPRFPAPMAYSFGAPVHADPAAPRALGRRPGIELSFAPVGRFSDRLQPDARTDDPNVGTDWLNLVSAWWRRHAYYPPEAGMNNEQGDVTVRLIVGHDGKVESVRLEQRSGMPFLDMGAIAIFRNATLPPLPSKVKAQSIPVHFTIHYIIVG